MQWIKEYQIVTPNLCENLIEAFKAAKELGFVHEGLSAKGVDKKWKDSEDVSLNCLPAQQYKKHVTEYREHVMQSIRSYISEFKVLATSGAKVGFLEPPQIQHYEPGGAFFGEHYESSGLDISHRILAFMTYLNTVNKGGGTHFLYQDHICNAKVGSTIVWPAGFTHAHKGIPAPNEHKYIITGWLSYTGS